MGATLAELAHRCYSELRGDPDHEITRNATLETAGPNGINLIQIAHNEHVGEDTAMAACVGIAGSTRVGKRCTFAGQVGVVEHIQIADDVHITGATVCFTHDPDCRHLLIGNAARNLFEQAQECGEHASA